MDIGSIFLILALIVLVMLFIGRPFFEETRPAKSKAGKASRLADQEDQQRSTLMAERDRVLNALQELDFDYTMGKIPEEDYPQQRSSLLHQGADILRRLDALQAVQQPESAEARLEAAIAARRAAKIPVGVTAGGNGHGQADDELEVQIAARKRLREGKSGGFCPNCGGPVQAADRFCPRCGKTLKK